MDDLRNPILTPGVYQSLIVENPDLAMGYCVARHFVVVSAPESSLIPDWDSKTPKEQRMYAAAVVKEAFDDGYRELEDRLSSQSPVAKAAGFDDGAAVPTYSTLDRWISDLDQDVIEEAVNRAENAYSHSVFDGTPPEELPPNPGKPGRYYDHIKVDQEEQMNRKMAEATHQVEQYFQLIEDSIGFGRDHSANPFIYETGEFYQVLAHLALEGSFANNGTQILRWLKDDIDVPPPNTIRDYATKYSVRKWEEKFMRASCELLSQPRIRPSDPLTLAFDVTRMKWYGDEDHAWTTGNLKEDNTNQFWHIGVLCICTSEYNYILGATPIQSKDRQSAALRRMLRRFRKFADFETDRCYLDSEFYQGAAFEACRDLGVDAMIQAKDAGAAGDLLGEVVPGEYKSEADVEFSDLHPRPDVFVAPVNPEETGAENQDSHSAWITDLDVTDRDLRGLAYQYRYRWRIETAINQLKNTFLGRCKYSQREVRTLYFGAAQMFFNFWVALQADLPKRMGDMADPRLTGQELLHAVREADF